MAAGGSPMVAFATRFALAHLLAYPLLFWASLAGMSLCILIREGALWAAAAQSEPASAFQRWAMVELGLEAAEAASFEVVLGPLAVVLALLFVVTHGGGLAWGVGAKRSAVSGDQEHERRGRRVFLMASLGLTGLITLLGALGWIRLLTM